MARNYIIFTTCILMVFLVSCSKQSALDKHILALENPDKPKVFMIFAPDCPLCINYADKFEELYEDFSQEFDFYAILPGTYYSSTEVRDFADQTGLKRPIIYDTTWAFCEALEATVTPEFFVYRNGAIVYSGKFDDWAALIGRKKRKVTEFYVKDALLSIRNKAKIKIKSTQAVGCILEYRND
jgi:thiol-disulfide isomerase/thioredoxin